MPGKARAPLSKSASLIGSGSNFWRFLLMQSMTLGLTLSQASVIVDEALKAARSANLAPITLVALDAGGHVVVAKREDNSSTLRIEIARGKAAAALGMGRSSRDLEG